MKERLPANRLGSIDALRGLAALTVVVYHARAMLWIGLGETWARYRLTPDLNNWIGYASAPLAFGGLAVALFFVLSGYCIHRKGALTLASRPDARLNLKQFFVRRLWRIYPVYFVSLCLTALIDGYLILYSPQSAELGYDNSPFTFAMSLLSLQGLAAPQFGSNGVFWTLALELHFYLIYPVLYYLSRKYGGTAATIVTLLASVFYIVFDISTGFSDQLPYRSNGVPIFLAYWFTWGFGFYLAEVEAGRVILPRKFWLFAGLATVLILPTAMLHYQPLSYFNATLAFGGLIWWSKSDAGEKFWQSFAGGILTRIGVFSYSLYAIHIPCILLFKSLISPSFKNFVSLIPVVFAVIVSLGCGYLFYKLVEQWSLKSPPKFNW